ncbi:unnamed protein product, partial [Trichogramma brassicae]
MKKQKQMIAIGGHYQPICRFTAETSTRPYAPHADHESARQNLSEFPPELESDRSRTGPTYAISEMIVRGLCSCHGHSSHCPGSEMDLGHGGAAPASASTTRRQVMRAVQEVRIATPPWRRAQGLYDQRLPGLRCNGNSRQCRFDAGLYEKKRLRRRLRRTDSTMTRAIIASLSGFYSRSQQKFIRSDVGIRTT